MEMNLQSVILLIVIAVAFIAAVVYLVRNKKHGMCGDSGCDGDCAHCNKMRNLK